MMRITAALVSLCAFSNLADAATLGFVNSPNSNSTDWTAAVTAAGGTVNSAVDFDAMTPGALDGTFYSASQGVTITTSGAVGGVVFGTGPAQSNTSGALPTARSARWFSET